MMRELTQHQEFIAVLAAISGRVTAEESVKRALEIIAAVKALVPEERDDAI